MKIALILLIVLLLPVIAFAQETQTSNWLDDNNMKEKILEKAQELNGIFKNVAYLLITLFFILGILFAWVKFFNMQDYDFINIIVRTIFVFLLLISYDSIFNNTYLIIDKVISLVGPVDFMDGVQEVIQKSILQEQAIRKEQIGESGMGWMGRRVFEFITWGAGHFLSLCIEVMGMVRYFFIGLLYALGVLCIPFIIFPAAANVLRGWFISVLEVGVWPFFWKTILVFFVAFQPDKVVSFMDLIRLSFYYILVGVFVLQTPKLVSWIIRGVGVGAGASMVGTLAMAFGTHQLKQGIDKSKRGFMRFRRWALEEKEDKKGS